MITQTPLQEVAVVEVRPLHPDHESDLLQRIPEHQLRVWGADDADGLGGGSLL